MRRSATRAAEVLRWIGLDAAEIILDRLAQGEALGVRGFYYDVVGGMPGGVSAGDAAAARAPIPTRSGTARRCSAASVSPPPSTSWCRS